MRPAPFDFVAPTDLDELTGVLAEHGTGAAVLAGGQSLVPELNKRIRRPAVLVGLTGIPGLRGCGADGALLRIGARVTQQEAYGHGGPLAEALRHVGYASTRNWGTVVGSIAYADPAGEIPVTLLALGASVTARSVRGTRTVPLAQLYATAFRTTLAADEVLLEAVVPAVGPGWAWAFEQRSHRRRAKVSAVAGCGPDGALRLAVTGVGERPELVTAGLAELSAAVVAAKGTARACATVAAGCAAAVTHPGDLHGSSDYRRRLTAAAVGAALERAIRGSEAGR